MVSVFVRRGILKKTHLEKNWKRRFLTQLARISKTLKVEQKQISILLTNNDTLHHLNLLFAKEDHPTDVLSFSQSEEKWKHASILGDIAISVEMAIKQAEKKGHSIEYEILYLAVHGICHLLGYDHRTSSEEKEMFGLTANLVKVGMKQDS